MKKFDKRLILMMLNLILVSILLLATMDSFLLMTVCLSVLFVFVKELIDENVKLKGALGKLDSNYILKLTMEQFMVYMDSIVLRSLIQSIREDIAEPKQIPKKQRYKMITDNSMVRYLNYFTNEIPFIESVYGIDYIIKHYNFYIDHVIATGDLDKLITKYSAGSVNED